MTEGADDPALEAARAFDLGAPPQRVEAQGGGLINRSYRVHVQGVQGPRFVLQRINTAVFRDVAGVMANIQRVLAHLGAAGEPRLVPTRRGAAWHEDADRACWRLYRFVAGARTHETAPTPERAHAVAAGFGRFQSRLLDLPGERLCETIAGFHDTPRRLEAFRAAAARDAAGRRGACAAEIEFVLRREGACGTLMRALGSGEVPERIAHNDAKPNNAMIDDATGRCRCVVDLDTVMPGSALFDFGDMVRSMGSGRPEDEPDAAKVALRADLFGALVRGYASEARFLTARERELLPASGLVITLENGIRFLSDYLDGDTYYRTARPGQNLDRARAHFALVASIERQEDALMGIVREAFGGGAS